MQVRLVGVYDGFNYRSYTRIQDFLNSELTPRNSGMWYYAHAGGLADIQFILEYLIENPNPSIRVSCAFSGSSAIIVRISNGKYSWYLLDSFWLIRQKLRDIGEWMGHAKGGEEGSTDIFYGPLDTLIEYNRDDCIILHDAIRTLEDTVLGLGGRLEMTIASTAMGLFRRRYLSREIHTNDALNEIASQAYIGSRVEVFEKSCTNADYYDINSSFPYSMTFEAPGELVGTSRRLKDSKTLTLVKATVSVNECDLPPVPYRTPTDRRIYFPIGTWTQWFSGVDIELLKHSGHTIQKVEKVLEFEPFHDLKNYAQDIYELRKNSSHAAEKIVLKFLLNSTYGKFAEGETKSKYLINPGVEFYDVPEYTPERGEGRSYVMPGVYELVEKRTIPHRHVPIAMHITALSRKWLYQYMNRAEKVFYCDTDGFAVPNSDTFPESNELGGLKKEKHIFEGHFHAPKTYAYRTEKGGDWVVKAKGFSRIQGDEGETRTLNYNDFCHLIEHKELHVEQFTRVRSMLKSGSPHPHDVDRQKTFRDTTRPKRCFDLGTGRSRPWTIGELEK
jgi:predicted DNA-binding transcriptional regulator AlpA